MSYVLYPGCKVPYHVPQYGQSASAVLDALGVKAVETELGCCGYPMRRLYPASHLAAAARTLAMAEHHGDTMICLCMCCYGTLKKVAARLEEDSQARATVDADLAEEGLKWTGKLEIEHLTTILAHKVGPKAIAEKVTQPLTGLKVASLYGCQALRPSKATHYDDPWNPTLLESLVTATGATPVPWAGWIECCGNPIRESNPELSLAIINKRLEQSGQAGAEVLSLSCPHSAMQASWAWEQANEANRQAMLGAALYPQLLGLAMGIAPAKLGIDNNHPPVAELLAQRQAEAREAEVQQAAG